MPGRRRQGVIATRRRPGWQKEKGKISVGCRDGEELSGKGAGGVISCCSWEGVEVVVLAFTSPWALGASDPLRPCPPPQGLQSRSGHTDGRQRRRCRPRGWLPAAQTGWHPGLVRAHGLQNALDCREQAILSGFQNTGGEINNCRHR